MDVAALIHTAQDGMKHPFPHGQKVTLPHLSEIFSSPHVPLFRPRSQESDSDWLSDSSEKHSAKKKRCNLPKETTDILLRWLEMNLRHPYPSAQEKMQLVYDTGLSHQQLSNWFINARRRRMSSLRDKHKNL